MVLSVIFNLIAKGILFLLTVLIAFFFGSDIRTDIYFFVYGAMVILAGLINSIDAAVLVPESMRLRESEGNHKAMAFLNRFLWIYIIIGILFTTVLYFGGLQIFNLVSRFPEEAVVRYENYFLLGSLLFVFMLLTNFLNAILSSLKYFTAPMIISGINSCVAIAGILLLHARYDVLSVFIGSIIAYCINLLLLLALLKRNAGWTFISRPAPVDKKTRANIGFTLMGQLATLASNFLPLYLMSGLGQGIISSMNYGKNIADIPNTMVTAQVTGVSGIQLNELAAEKNNEGIIRSFGETGKLLLFLLIPVAGYFFVFAQPIVELFYQRGNFSAESVSGAAGFLQLFSVTGFIIGINALVSRVFMATQTIRPAFIYQMIMNGLLIAAIWYLTEVYGAWGYPYALIGVYSLNLLMMHFLCRQLPVDIRYADLLPYAVLLLLINGAIAAVLYFSLPYLHLKDFSLLLTGFIAYLFLYLIINRMVRLNPFPGQFFHYVRNRFL